MPIDELIFILVTKTNSFTLDLMDMSIAPLFFTVLLLSNQEVRNEFSF